MEKRFFKYALATLLVGLPTVSMAEVAATEENMSYAVGSSFGQNMIDNKLDVNLDSFINGLKDSYAGKSKLSTEDTEKLLATFDKKVRDGFEKQLAEQAKVNKASADKYLAKNSKQPNVKTLPGGVQYEVLANTSDPKATSPNQQDLVSVHYRGTLLDGTQFDSSYDRNSPAKFPVGNVIKGWQQVLTKMKVGDKWKVVIPPELAYGETGAGSVIPPNSALIFEIELLGVER